MNLVSLLRESDCSIVAMPVRMTEMTVMMMIVRMVSVPESPPHLAKKGKSNALSASAFYHGRYFHSPQTYNIQNSYPTFLICIRPVFILLYLPTATTLSSVYLLCASKYANKVKSTYTAFYWSNQTKIYIRPLQEWCHGDASTSWQWWAT